MGPAVFDTGRGFDMGPHPHIGLAAVTYLIDGEIVHRDSLGKVQTLRPGEVSLVTARLGDRPFRADADGGSSVREQFFRHSGLGCPSLQA